MGHEAISRQPDTNERTPLKGVTSHAQHDRVGQAFSKASDCCEPKDKVQATACLIIHTGCFCIIGWALNAFWLHCVSELASAAASGSVGAALGARRCCPQFCECCRETEHDQKKTDVVEMQPQAEIPLSTIDERTISHFRDGLRLMNGMTEQQRKTLAKEIVDADHPRHAAFIKTLADLQQGLEEQLVTEDEDGDLITAAPSVK